MKISLLLAELQVIQAAHPDLEIWLEDPDTGMILDIDIVLTTRMDGKGYNIQPGPLHVAITADYGDEIVREAETVPAREAR